MRSSLLSVVLILAIAVSICCSGEGERRKSAMALAEAQEVAERHKIAAQKCEDTLDKSETLLRDLQRQVTASLPIQLVNAQLNPESLSKLPPEVRDELIQKLAIFQADVKRELDYLINQNRELKNQVVRSGKDVEQAIQQQTQILDTSDEQRFTALDGQLKAIEEAARLKIEQQRKISTKVEELVSMITTFDRQAKDWFLGRRKDDVLAFHGTLLVQFVKMQETLRELEEEKN